MCTTHLNFYVYKIRESSLTTIMSREKEIGTLHHLIFVKK